MPGLLAGSAQTIPVTGLAGEIHTALLANGCVPGDNATFQKLCDGIASAVIAHFKANGVILPTALVAPAGGGAVTGTGTIT